MALCPPSSLSPAPYCTGQGFAWQKQRVQHPMSHAVPEPWLTASPPAFPSSLGVSHDGLRLEWSICWGTWGGHPLGYPHLGSAFTLLLMRVWMTSTYCLGAWGLAARKGHRFAGASCPPAAHDALLSGGVALVALLAQEERSRAGG